MSMTEARAPLARPVTHLPLSVCCVTHASPEQTHASVVALAGVAREVVVAVDERRSGQLDAYAAFADRVLVVPTGIVERNLAAVHEACSQEWVLRVDSDEAVSPALVARLPVLLADEAARQYAIARRCVVGDGGSWIDEWPWWPDFQVRLVRTSGASFSGDVHTSARLASPRPAVTEPLLHFDCILSSPLERQAKILRYEATRPDGLGALRDPITRLYAPERHARRPPAPLPADELETSRAYLETATAGRVAPRRRAAPPAVAPPARAGEALLEPLERDLTFVAGQHRTLTVRVTNAGHETWPGDAPLRTPGGFFVSYRWRRGDGSEIEGARTPLPETLKPGASCVALTAVVPPEHPGPASLDLAVVCEEVRWLSGEHRAATEVVPPPPLPERRERRAPRGAAGPAIPRVLHRVWLGDRPLPSTFAAFSASWAHHHPAWKLRLWTDADAPAPPGIERARNLAERADLVRYEVLRRHGGVYVDTDVECLRPIDELLDGVAAFAAYEVPGRLCNAVLGAVPGHAAFRRATELAAITVGTGTYPEATATSFLTYLLEPLDDVTLFGAERFYPELWNGARNVGQDPPYAVHHWSKTWERRSGA